MLKDYLSKNNKEIMAFLTNKFDENYGMKIESWMTAELKKMNEENINKFEIKLIDLSNKSDKALEELNDKFSNIEKSLANFTNNFSEKGEDMTKIMNALKNDVEVIKLDYGKSGINEEIKNNFTDEISKLNFQYTKNNEDNLLKFNQLIEKINVVNSTLLIKIDNINEMILKDSQALSHDLMEYIASINDKNAEIIKIQTNDRHDNTLKFDNLNKIINTIQADLKEKISSDNNKSKEMINSMESSLIKTSNETITEEIRKNCLTHETKIEEFKKDPDNNNESNDSLKNEILLKLDKSIEDTRILFDKELKETCLNLKNEILKNENIFNKSLEINKSFIKDELLVFREEFQQNLGKSELQFNDLKNKISEKITIIEKENIYNKDILIENSKKIELISQLDDKIQIISDEVKKNESQIKENHENHNNLLIKSNLKINELFDCLTENKVILDSFSSDLKTVNKYKLQILKDLDILNLKIKCVDDLEKYNTDNSKSIISIENKINSTENNIIEKINLLEKSVSCQDNKNLTIGSNLFTKEESELRFMSFKDECFKYINEKFDLNTENTNHLAMKLSDLQNLIETKISESKKSFNKISESIILENNKMSHKLNDFEKNQSLIQTELKNIFIKFVDFEKNTSEFQNSHLHITSNIDNLSKQIDIVNNEINTLHIAFSQLQSHQIKTDENGKIIESNANLFKETLEKKLASMEINLEDLQKVQKSLSSDLDNYNKNSTILESNTRNYIQKEVTTIKTDLKQIKSNYEKSKDETSQMLEGLISKNEEIQNSQKKLESQSISNSNHIEEEFTEFKEKLNLLSIKSKDLENSTNFIEIKSNETDLALKGFQNQHEEFKNKSKSEINQILSEFEEKLKLLEIKSNDFETSCNKLEIKSNQSDIALKGLQNKHNELESQSYSKINQIASDFKEKVKLLEIKSKDCETCYNELEIKSNQSDIALKGLQNQLNELGSQIYSNINQIMSEFEEKIKSLENMTKDLKLSNNKLEIKSNQTDLAIKNHESLIQTELKNIFIKFVDFEKNTSEFQNSHLHITSNIDNLSKQIDIVNNEINTLHIAFSQLQSHQIKTDENGKIIESNANLFKETLEKKLASMEINLEDLQKVQKSLSSDLDNYNKNSTILESNTRNYIQKEVTTIKTDLKQIKSNYEKSKDETSQMLEGLISKNEEIQNSQKKLESQSISNSNHIEEEFTEFKEKLNLLSIKSKDLENSTNFIEIKSNQTDLALKNHDSSIKLINYLQENTNSENDDKFQKLSKLLNEIVSKNKEIEDENTEFDIQFLEEFKDMKSIESEESNHYNSDIEANNNIAYSDDEEYAFSIKNQLLLKNKFNKCETISKSKQIKKILFKVESFSLLRFKYLSSMIRKYISSQEKLEKIIINHVNSRFVSFEEMKNKLDSYFSVFNSKFDNISHKVQSINEYLVLK